MNRFVHAFMRFVAVALLATAFPAAASIHAPDHIYYGSVTLFGMPAPNGTAVELRTVSGNAVLARYVVGSNSHLGGLYRLDVPMDQVDPRTPGRARPGDPIRIHVAGQLAHEAAVGAVGITTRLDLDPQNMGTGPAISIANAQVYEGQAGQTPVILNVSLNTTSDRVVGIQWETRDGTAQGGASCVAGMDFVHRSGTLNIPAGQMAGTIAVQVCGDEAVEPNEQFSVVLLSTTDDYGVLTTQSVALISVLDDDNVPTLAVGNVRVAEPPSGTATARFLATLSRAHENAVSFTWATQNVSANAGTDYVGAGGTVTIPAGETSAYLDVAVLSDAVIEPDETFRLFFSNPQSLGLPQTYAYGTIVDPRHDPALEETDAVTDADVADLDQPSAIVLSPDGLHAYAASGTKNAVLHFSRDPDTGKLTHVASYKTSVAGFNAAKLKNPQDIKLSADGGFIYVAARGDSAMTVLARDPGDGTLTFVHSLANGGQIQGLDDVVRLVLSPDGKHVYAVGRSSNSIGAFVRDGSTGEVSFAQALSRQSPGMQSLSQPNGIAISPEGTQVYVTSRMGNAVLAFDRNTDTAHANYGRLTFKTSYTDGLNGITGLKGAFGIALSSDGRQVYVVSEQDNSVVLFDRTSATGALGQRRVWKHGEPGLHGLRGAQGVEVAPNGREVFVTGNQDDSLTVFHRTTGTGQTAGQLAVHRTLFKGDNGLNHLDTPGAMASSMDDRYLYVVASGIGNSAIVTYRRLSANVLFEDGFEDPPALQE
ncbi:beta-propeller fold lactonase family protein [Xanthomonadaceae bacterium JHOS43]|nr:beta-propeller fold lactonase family protein [Xanthomonadaceae bacterium JHOS43]